MAVEVAAEGGTGTSSSEEGNKKTTINVKFAFPVSKYPGYDVLGNCYKI